VNDHRAGTPQRPIRSMSYAHTTRVACPEEGGPPYDWILPMLTNYGRLTVAVRFRVRGRHDFPELRTKQPRADVRGIARRTQGESEADPVAGRPTIRPELESGAGGAARELAGACAGTIAASEELGEAQWFMDADRPARYSLVNVPWALHGGVGVRGTHTTVTQRSPLTLIGCVSRPSGYGRTPSATEDTHAGGSLLGNGTPSSIDSSSRTSVPRIP
jgi:hypothetical protein